MGHNTKPLAQYGSWLKKGEKFCPRELWLEMVNCKYNQRIQIVYYLLCPAVASVKRQLLTVVKDVEWEFRKAMQYLHFHLVWRLWTIMEEPLY
jgi:hypothetical protein